MFSAAKGTYSDLLETSQDELLTSNQILLSKLKKKFEEDRVVLFFCQCDSLPVDCLCEDIRISVQFNSDVNPLPEGILAVRLTRNN